MNLKQLGFTEERIEQTKAWNEKDYEPARIAQEHKGMYTLLSAYGEIRGTISGKMNFEAMSREDYPAVGDWVMCQVRASEGTATIHGVLPRTSKFSRKIAGTTTEEQIIATNIDTVFLVNAMNKDLNLRRIERYLLMAWESGANPVIVLSKSDLCENVAERVNEVETVALGVPIIVISAQTGEGLVELNPYLEDGKTVALLGSSGAGKSTLVNCLYGEEVQKVKEIREGDDKGVHTTTHRELFLLPSGGSLIDTPGMRELQLWNTEDGLSESFQDIESLAEACKFRDCQHEDEPGCAVQGAIQTGDLTTDRFTSFKKLQRELAYLERKNDQKAQLQEKKKWKTISKSMRR
ncbi:ribosome small subunit-dependent GTPase A [Pseudalkalibacillus berkeleyi]|uniref:Small ribosomal subunit biogenesis GTPase RsgA n=1 Tax=Pseudalkalibacillus berkeleyi TaxID=1069813 RepID=A0ABS9H6I2_9BACL|nr:ribosome small subunit-dependent GTPase A [Pseudalkalibacillus berkeleyi]MCF6139285.1 ribosome small subunit-dependent GTPase A [Pseudalkalibacillus berkeleyi]